MKIKLVVVNENLLGYIHPNDVNHVGCLRASAVKGSSHDWKSGAYCLGHGDVVRLASEKDFADFHVSFNGYKNNPQEYEFATA